jgi:hypothetical protein
MLLIIDRIDDSRFHLAGAALPQIGRHEVEPLSVSCHEKEGVALSGKTPRHLVRNCGRGTEQ